jgi:Domain of unknown function (DUF4160)
MSCTTTSNPSIEWTCQKLRFCQPARVKCQAYKGYETKMPTILLLLGWRIFFYANEGNEPAHVHCRKGEKECKYWLDRENFDLEEAYAYNLSSRDRREIKKIIFDHFEYIEQQWDEFQRRRLR